MARDTIAATIIATTIIGNEEARSNPGFFFCPVQTNSLATASTIKAAMQRYIRANKRRSCLACRSEILPVMKSVNGSCTAAL